MNHRSTFPILPLLAVCFQQLSAELITPTTFFFTSSNDFYPRSQLIDGSGLDVITDQHSTAGPSNSWVTNASGTDYFESGPAIDFFLDLGSVIGDLDALVYWGYVLDGNRTAEGNEAKTFRLTFSTNQTIDPGDPVETVTATRPTGQVRRTLHFANSHTARYVKIEILANYPELSGGDRVGLGELKFLRDASTTVTNNADSGAGSLRQAIADSKIGGAVYFDPSLSGSTIDLQSELLVDRHLTIDASALPAGVIINGGSNGDFIQDAGETRCFNIDDGTFFPKAVHLRNLTVSGGVGQGANVFSGENLKMVQCHISEGRAFGSLSQSRGGGIYIDKGSLEMIDSTVTGNRTGGNDGNGGGIYVRSGRTAISRCTISDNVTSGTFADGGGLFLRAASADPPPIVERCTFSGNQASGSRGGGIYNESSNTLFTHCTVVGNSAPDGAGILDGKSSTLTATIVRDNDGANDLAHGQSVSGGFSSGGGNVIGVRGTGVPAFAGETSSAALNLAPLGEYGGPTETMPPLPGSLAIGRVGGILSPTDQRGFPMLSTPDAGAAEYQGFLDIIRFWNLDPDGDGSPFGVELALGTDNLSPDPQNPNNFAMDIFPIDGSERPVAAFTISPDAPEGTLWVISRSPDLTEGSFIRLLTSDGSGVELGENVEIQADPGSSRVFVIDNLMLPGKAFYRFEAIPPGP